MRHSQIWENRFLENSCLATIKRKCRFCVLAEASLKKRGKKNALLCVLRHCGIVTVELQIQMEIVFRHQSLHVVVLSSPPTPTLAGLNQFNHMALPNAQLSQAPMGARAASPMNHPQQMNLSSVPAVRRRRGEGHLKKKIIIKIKHISVASQRHNS